MTTTTTSKTPTPLQLLEEGKKEFADAFLHHRALNPRMSDFAIISGLLENDYWKDWANIGSYQGARKVLDRLVPGWKTKTRRG